MSDRVNIYQYEDYKGDKVAQKIPEEAVYNSTTGVRLKETITDLKSSISGLENRLTEKLTALDPNSSSLLSSVISDTVHKIVVLPPGETAPSVSDGILYLETEEDTGDESGQD